jgi:hypothetical protein
MVKMVAYKWSKISCLEKDDSYSPQSAYNKYNCAVELVPAITDVGPAAALSGTYDFRQALIIPSNILRNSCVPSEQFLM